MTISTTTERLMTALMQGKRGLIMGVAHERSIAWGIARVLSGHGPETTIGREQESNPFLHGFR